MGKAAKLGEAKKWAKPKNGQGRNMQATPLEGPGGQKLSNLFILSFAHFFAKLQTINTNKFLHS